MLKLGESGKFYMETPYVIGFLYIKKISSKKVFCKPKIISSNQFINETWNSTHQLKKETDC